MSDEVRFFKEQKTFLQVNDEDLYVLYRGKLRSMSEIVDLVLEERLKERVDIIPYNNPKRILKHLYGLFKEKFQKKG